MISSLYEVFQSFFKNKIYQRYFSRILVNFQITDLVAQLLVAVSTTIKGSSD